MNIIITSIDRDTDEVQAYSDNEVYVKKNIPTNNYVVGFITELESMVIESTTEMSFYGDELTFSEAKKIIMNKFKK